MTTILNVDDNSASRYARSAVLRQAGYTVVEATTGEEAFEKVKEIQPALVLLDVHLPDMSGFDVCKKIKGQPQGASTPVLHISATAIEESDLITGLQAADAYVVEPVEPEMLLAFVGALLRGSELIRQWMAVFDALADGVALLNSEGAILRCNSAFCRLLGKRIGEVLGANIASALAEIRCEDEVPAFPKSLRTRQSETAECDHGEKTYRFSSHLATVRGGVAGAIYIIADVTKERRASREKEEAYALLRALTEGAPVGFAFLDQEMRYRLVNPELASFNGVPVSAHIGRTIEEVVPTLAADVRRVIQRVVETGEPVLDHELIGETPKAPGQSRSWSASCYPVRSADGRLTGIGWAVVETTEQKRAEKERQDFEKRVLEAQRLESIGLLAGGIAHDFNNLLTAVLGNASLARELSPSNSPVANFLDEIVKASERAAHLTSQMLAYSGKGQFYLQTVDLSQETREVVALVQSAFSNKISVHLDLPDDLPKVRADKGQLQQVVMNIVVNASEAIGDASGFVYIRTGTKRLTEDFIRSELNGAEVAEGLYACLEVRDTGCGMDDATRERVFDPFFSTKFTGRGLGLAAVGGIVRGHKGAIQVRSTPGKGSTFVVYLPVAAVTAPAKQTARQERRSKVFFQGTVLVVDDEDVVLRTARSALERQGCSVLVAESGPSAIDILRLHADEVSLIILDLSMPGMSGLEVLPELRKIRPDIPIVVSSGYSESETLRLFSGYKISGFLQKPYTLQRLVERVTAAVAV
ncbi:MAG TPA: response regulator [Bryobacteraceae bacterium]|nr:response regulator [Bryobacteraceae bacterium]